MAPQKSGRRAILCFHGTGSKGTIFQVQLARICFLLGKAEEEGGGGRGGLEFIFVDGPLECAAGPGVLPVFAGQEPYYSWFAGSGTCTIDESLVKISAAVQKSIAAWKEEDARKKEKKNKENQRGIAGSSSSSSSSSSSESSGSEKEEEANENDDDDDDVEIVGGIGFSEGALALALLLWQQQQQQQQQQKMTTQHDSPSSSISLPDLLPRLRFAVMSCCFFPDEASKWLTATAQAAGQEKAVIDTPTLHVHGNRDFCLGRARRLVRNHYDKEKAIVVKTEAGHHLPTKKEEVGEVVERIVEMSRRRRRRSVVTTTASA